MRVWNPCRRLFLRRSSRFWRACVLVSHFVLVLFNAPAQSPSALPWATKTMPRCFYSSSSVLFSTSNALMINGSPYRHAVCCQAQKLQSQPQSLYGEAYLQRGDGCSSAISSYPCACNKSITNSSNNRCDSFLSVYSILYMSLNILMAPKSCTKRNLTHRSTNTLIATCDPDPCSRGAITITEATATVPFAQKHMVGHEQLLLAHHIWKL